MGPRLRGKVCRAENRGINGVNGARTVQLHRKSEESNEEEDEEMSQMRKLIYLFIICFLVESSNCLSESVQEL
jgi:hypothetical protein